MGWEWNQPRKIDDVNYAGMLQKELTYSSFPPAKKQNLQG
jgi:hypothetical protein